jgi:enoyl-[acyl-carrier protein] reductase II
LIKNEFYQKVEKAYENGANAEELEQLLGRGRAKKGMFEGDLTEGELEVGQISGIIKEIKPAAEIVAEILNEFRLAIKEQQTEKFSF